jgi:hypothetical protein
MLSFLARNIPGIRPAQAQLTMWRDQMRELRPLYPVVLPFLLWVFTRAYQKEQERLRLEQLEPILRPDKRPQS